MSDYRFGVDDYRLNIYPSEAFNIDGGFDIEKVESVEIERVDFVRERTCHRVLDDELANAPGWHVKHRCSLCGEKLADVNYCPNCGAKVVSADD